MDLAHPYSAAINWSRIRRENFYKILWTTKNNPMMGYAQFFAHGLIAFPAIFSG